MSLELAKLADNHTLLGFHYLGACYLVLPFMGLLMWNYERGASGGATEEELQNGLKRWQQLPLRGFSITTRCDLGNQ